MAASSTAMAATLAQLLGLDEPTVTQQILPYLDSIKTSQQIQSHLQSLLPPGYASQSFIRSYLNHRFPTTTTATTTSSTRPTTPSTSSSTVTKLDAWGKPIVTKPSVGSRRPAAIHAPPPLDQPSLQSQFSSYGKVYQKNRHEDEDRLGGWGASSSTSKPNSRSNSGRTTPIQPTPSTIPRPVHHPTISATTSKGKVATPEIVELSETARIQLTEIDRSLRLLNLSPSTSTKKDRSCFCSGLTHPLSTYIPLCTSCGLILCSLNPPRLSCPSCSNSNLISSHALDSHIALLEEQRNDLIEREKRRREMERQQEIAERAAIRFPELNDASSSRRNGVGGVGGGMMGQGRMGYADLVGGGRAGNLEERIERAYQEGRTLNGREFGTKNESVAPQKVLRLDMKTRKVKVQTKTRVSRKIDEEAKKESVVGEQDRFDDSADDEEEHGQRWIDEMDDGWRERHGLGRPQLTDPRIPERPFLNVTIFDEERPKWVEPVTIDVEPLPSTLASEEYNDALSRRSVPGAAPGKGVENKKTRNRKKGKNEGSSTATELL